MQRAGATNWRRFNAPIAHTMPKSKRGSLIVAISTYHSIPVGGKRADSALKCMGIGLCACGARAGRAEPGGDYDLTAELRDGVLGRGAARRWAARVRVGAAAVSTSAAPPSCISALAALRAESL